MHVLDGGLRRYAQIADRGSKLMAFALVGEFLGNLVGLAIPDSLAGDAQLGHMVAALLAGLYLLGLFTKYRLAQSQALEDCLADAELLFINDAITLEEYRRLRAECFRKRGG